MVRLLLLALLLSVGPVHAQSQRPIDYRDPGIATLISVLAPGAGHFYAGEIGTGLALVSVGYGAPIAGFVITVLSEEERCAAGGCIREVDFTPLLVGGVISLGAYVYGIADAGRAADRSNRRRGISDRVRAEPRVAVDGGRLGPGVALRVPL